MSNLFTNRTGPDLSLLFLCTEPGSWCLDLIPMSATSVGYKTCIIFSEFTMNNFFLKQRTVMGNKKLFQWSQMQSNLFRNKEQKSFCLFFLEAATQKRGSGSLVIAAS